MLALLPGDWFILGVVNLTKIIARGIFWDVSIYFRGPMPPNFLTVFLTGVCAAGSGLVGGAFWLVYLCVAFNNIISEVQGWEAAGRSTAYGP